MDNNNEVVEGDGRVIREINLYCVCYVENLKIGCVFYVYLKELMLFVIFGMELLNLIEVM